MKKLGLNIGCGQKRIESSPGMTWANIDIDPDSKADLFMYAHHVGPDQFRDVDEILAEDILEHMPYRENNKDEWKRTLRKWASCLKRGGTIRIQVPCIDNVYKLFHNGEINEDTMLRVIYGERTNLYDRHYQIFTALRLELALIEMGLEIVETHDLFINVVTTARRP